jgi:hypothetical protein
MALSSRVHLLNVLQGALTLEWDASRKADDQIVDQVDN